LGILNLASAQAAFNFDDFIWFRITFLLDEYLRAVVVVQVLAALAIICVLLSSEATELHRGAANAWQEGSSFWLSCILI
jgi:hypothetical protein